MAFGQINCYLFPIKTLQGNHFHIELDEAASASALYQKTSMHLGEPVENINIVVGGQLVKNNDDSMLPYVRSNINRYMVIVKRPAASATPKVSAAAVTEVAIDELAACRAEVAALRAENADLLERMLL